MPSLILQTATRFLITLLLMLPIFLFFRGHNEPGGGFVAGLVAAASVGLYAIAYGVATAREVIRFDSRWLMGFGLILAMGSGMAALLTGRPFLTGKWFHLGLPGFPGVEVGTPLLFDLGVALTVFGVVVTILFSLMEE